MGTYLHIELLVEARIRLENSAGEYGIAARMAWSNSQMARLTLDWALPHIAVGPDYFPLADDSQASFFWPI